MTRQQDYDYLIDAWRVYNSARGKHSRNNAAVHLIACDLWYRRPDGATYVSAATLEPSEREAHIRLRRSLYTL